MLKNNPLKIGHPVKSILEKMTDDNLLSKDKKTLAYKTIKEIQVFLLNINLSISLDNQLSFLHLNLIHLFLHSYQLLSTLAQVKSKAIKIIHSKSLIQATINFINKIFPNLINLK